MREKDGISTDGYYKYDAVRRDAREIDLSTHPSLCTLAVPAQRECWADASPSFYSNKLNNTIIIIIIIIYSQKNKWNV